MESGCLFSPDGQWLAHTSDESGREEAYSCRSRSGRAKFHISAEGFEPVWARNCQELFYRSGDKMMAVQRRPN